MSGSWSHSAATHLAVVACGIYADIFLCPYVCLCVCVCGIKNIFIVINRTFFYYYYSPLFLILTTQITQMYLADTFYFLQRCRVLFPAHILFIDRDKRHEANFRRTANDIAAIPYPVTPLGTYKLFRGLHVSAFCTPSWLMNYCRRYSRFTDFLTLVWCVAVSCPFPSSSLLRWLRFPQLTHNQGSSSCHMPLC